MLKPGARRLPIVHDCGFQLWDLGDEVVCPECEYLLAEEILRRQEAPFSWGGRLTGRPQG